MLALVFQTFFNASCNKFLDLKPDAKMLVPKSLEDCEALLNDRNTMNAAFQVTSETASDNYFLEKVAFDGLTVVADKESYLWDPNVNLNYTSWQGGHKVVMIANQILELLKKIDRNKDAKRYDKVKGSAMFFKAFAYLQLIDAFTLPYQKQTATQELGIVLKSSPDINEISKRSTLQQSYDEVVYYFKEAANLLPESSLVKTLPTKASAYAALARVGLIINDLDLTISSAKNSLTTIASLMDYNSLDQNSLMPFPVFNSEVLFHAVTLTSMTLTPSICFVDKELYDSYDDDDLRKVLYYDASSSGRYTFKGKYDGNQNSSTFCGFVLDEVYFTLAEAYVRNNQISLGENALNTIMEKRWRSNQYRPYQFSDKNTALNTILDERRKSMIKRSLRWLDMKRLSADPLTSFVAVRKSDENSSILNPGDLRYAFLIPLRVMNQTATIIQNKR